MEDRRPGVLDRLVDGLAGLLDSVGLNGSRLRWRWQRRRRELAERGARAANTLRSTRGKHKMCPACRALVDKSASTCSECGAAIGAVRGPGATRAATNLLPSDASATTLLLLVNGLLFVLMLMATIRNEDGGSIMRLAPSVTLRFGSAHFGLLVADGEWWRLISAMFLHGGVLHVGFNMWVLLRLGPLVESEFGAARTWVVYFCAGVVGNVAHVLIYHRAGVLGASGAVLGLVGLLLAYSMRFDTPGARMIKHRMIEFSILVLIISFLPGVSLWAHVGGFATGFGFGWLLPLGAARNRLNSPAWQAAAFVAILVALGAFYMVLAHGNDAIAKYLR